MEPFYLIVLAVAIVLLILILTYIGIKLRKSKKSIPFPPVANTCPDYWIADPSGCKIPTNKINMGNYNGIDYVTKCTDGSNCLDLTNAKLSTICQKQKFAYSNNIIWDGVSNYNSCPV